ncbi:MAG: metallophosphoesterase [Myxococcaceae bacterium]|nr:metallophosphoesterase [Myxococcaceae bacterium]
MPLPVRVVFGFLFVGLAAGLHWYLYLRLIKDVTDRRAVRLGAMSTFGAVAATSIFGFARFRTAEPSTLTMLLPMWFAFVIYVVIALITVDVVRWVVNRRQAAPPSPERRLFLSRAAALTGVVAGGGLASFGAWRAFSPARITEVPLKLAKLPKALDGMTLVQLSDVHIGPVLQRRFLDELVDRANQAKPDVVVITGDLVDGKPEFIGKSVEALTRLKSRYGTYFVTGNHDYYSGPQLWLPVLEGWGITVLRNRHVAIGDAGASFDLVGVDDWGGDYDLQAAIAGRDPSRASVLLAHQPANFDTVATAGLDLQLSGHTHGGQTFPGTIGASVIWGDRSAGLSKTKDSHLFVSRGCGFVGPPTRLGSPPEVVKLVLQSA